MRIQVFRLKTSTIECLLLNEDSTLKHISYTSENVQTFKTDCIFLRRFGLHGLGFVPTKQFTSLGIYRLMIFNPTTKKI